MAGSTKKFEYDRSKPARAQVDAAITATEPKRRVRRYGLEFAIAGVVLLIAAATFGPCFLPYGVVAAHRIPQGSALRSDDLKLVPMPANPQFKTTNATEGFVADRDVEPGEPLRRDMIRRPWASAHETIQRGEIIAPAAIEFKPGPFIDDGFADLSVVGRRTNAVIAKGTTIRTSMVDPRAAAMIALRDIAPFKLLTKADIANAPSRACSVAPIGEGSIVRPSDLATIDPQFDTLIAVKLANTVARTAPGSVATLIVMSRSKDGQIICVSHLQVQILRVTPSGDGVNAIIALSAKEHTRITAATELRALQEVQ
jgi:SAF domain.